jgi:hypothetical protein
MSENDVTIIAFPDDGTPVDLPGQSVGIYDEPVTVFPALFRGTPHLALAWERSDGKKQVTLLDREDALRVYPVLYWWLSQDVNGGEE